MTKLRKAVQNLDLRKQNVIEYIPAVLGINMRGRQVVEVPNRVGFVYARFRDNLSEVVQVYNDKVSPVFGLPVLIYRDNVDRTKYRIHARDVGRYDDWGSASSFLPRHGSQHSFVRSGQGGGDIVWVYGQQFMPLLAYPSGSNGSMGVMLGEYPYYDGTVWRSIGSTGTTSLSPYKPTGNSASIVLLYADTDNGNYGFRPGNSFAANVTGSVDILQHLPALNDDEIPIAAVRLVSGTNQIGWDNLYDLRPYFTGGGSGGGGSGTINGSGTNHRLAVWSGSSILSDSPVTVSGTTINIPHTRIVPDTDTDAFVVTLEENPTFSGRITNKVGHQSSYHRESAFLESDRQIISMESLSNVLGDIVMVEHEPVSMSFYTVGRYTDVKRYGHGGLLAVDSRYAEMYLSGTNTFYNLYIDGYFYGDSDSKLSIFGDAQFYYPDDYGGTLEIPLVEFHTSEVYDYRSSSPNIEQIIGHRVKDMGTTVDSVFGLYYEHQTTTGTSFAVYATGSSGRGYFGGEFEAMAATRHAIRTISTDTTLSHNDRTVLCDTTSAEVDVYLPDASSCFGREYVIKHKTGGNNVVVYAYTGQNIDGNSSKTITGNNKAIIIQSDGADWWILSDVP